MQQSQAFLKDEIREVEGHLPLSKKQREQLKKETEEARPKPLGDQSDKSAGDTVGDSKRGGGTVEDEERTPHTKRSGNK